METLVFCVIEKLLEGFAQYLEICTSFHGNFDGKRLKIVSNVLLQSVVDKIRYLFFHLFTVLQRTYMPQILSFM